MHTASRPKRRRRKATRVATPGERYLVWRPGRDEPKPISARIFVQDPCFAQQAAAARAAQPANKSAGGRSRRATPPVPVGMKRVTLGGEPWIGPGPKTSRLEVIDIGEDEFNASATTIRGLLRERAVHVLASGDGFATGAAGPARNRRLRQVNVWAVASHVLDHLESGMVFGRRLQWAFPGRLRIYPHWKVEDNAYYERESRGLFFGYFFELNDTRQRNPVYICLCHDTVAHELGHAVLDGLKPLYYEESTAQEAGFHEYFGDALAMTSALSMREVVAAVVGRNPGALDGSSLISDIASQFGNAMSTLYEDGPKACLRSAENPLTLHDVAAGFDRYDHSLVLTGAFYDILQALYARELELQQAIADNRKPGQRAVAALFNAADRTSRMLLRGLDYCPPAGLTYRAYVQGVMRADEVAFPVDARGYRAIAAEVFLRRALVDSPLELQPERSIANDRLWPYTVDALAASKTDAYHFLDRNREVLEIPRDVEIEVARIYRTSKLAAHGYRPPREVVVEFLWSETWTLRGKQFGEFAGTKSKVWCGGTLVFDTNDNVLHYCLTTRTRARMRQMKAYLVSSIEADEIDTMEPGKAMRPSARIRARIVDGQLELTRSPGMCHVGRGAAEKKVRRKGR